MLISRIEVPSKDHTRMVYRKSVFELRKRPSELVSLRMQVCMNRKNYLAPLI